MPVGPEKRGVGGAQVAVGWNSCGGIGRKCAFYNGFTGCVSKKLKNGRFVRSTPKIGKQVKCRDISDTVDVVRNDVI